MAVCGFTPALEDKNKKSRTYSRVREGIFSLSRLDFILAAHQAGASLTTARHRSVSQAASSHSSLRRVTKNNPFNWVSFTSGFSGFLGDLPWKVDIIKRSYQMRSAGSSARFASRPSPRRTGERLPHNWGSHGSPLTSMWLVGREERRRGGREERGSLLEEGG